MALPKSVMFRLRVTPDVIGTLQWNGVSVIDRSVERQVEIIEGHKAHKGSEFYYSDGKARENAAGWTVGASGITMMAFNPPDKETSVSDSTRAMTLEQVPIDLARAGFYLSHLQVVIVPGEEH